MFRIETIAEELREESRGLDFATFDGRDAARLTNVGAEIERLGAAIKLGFAKRAADTNGWHHASAATSSEQWLAGVSGCSEFQARDALQTAKRIEKCSATAQRLRDGSLSLAQASLVAKAAEVDPDAESRMLRTAEREGLRTLRDRSDRVVAAATDEIEAHARAKRERHLRTWRVGVATHGSFSGPSEDVDVFLRALKPFEQARFDQARKRDDDQQRETYDARCFDALIDLARNQRSGGSATSSPPVARVRVDLTALLAGETSSGEICEIPGVGPVPVDHARQVLAHGLLELVITDGVDVQTVVSRTRHVPEALKVAIAERDQRCKVRGCDRTHDLERHHTLEFSAHHLTTYELLGMLCGDHHDLVTYRGHDVVVHDDGTWSLRPPDYLDERLPGAA
jgi:hypothetical protein